MSDHIKQKLRQARDAIVPGDHKGKNSARFYDSMHVASDEDNPNVGSSMRKEEMVGSAEPLEVLLLRHRQLAQALLAVDGIEDDDNVSVASRGSSQGDIAILRHDHGTFSPVRPNDGASSATAEGPEGTSRSREPSLTTVGSDFVDLGHERSIVDLEQYYYEAIQDDASPWYQRLFVITMAWFVDLIDAFSETNDDVAIRGDPPPRLDVKELRQNIRRCKGQARPYLETAAGLWDVIAWRSPLYTLLLFWVYMYCVWTGNVISVFLGLVLLQLAMNYLSFCRKVKLDLILLPRKEIKQEYIDSPGAQLLLDVARQAQILLDRVVSMLEKIKNLLKWRRPRTTAMFTLLVLFWFIVSLLTSASVFLTIVGFGVGMKLFITSYLYYRFPRLRHKLDVFTWFLDRTPADKVLTKKSTDQHESGSPLNEQAPASSSMPPGSDAPKLTRTCALIDKEKSFPFNVGSGKLYVTPNHIAFKYSRWNAGERHVIKIHFDDILAIRKTKSTKLATFGDGTALEIFASGRDKPYLFAGIVRRDECYDTLLALGRVAGVNWAG